MPQNTTGASHRNHSDHQSLQPPRAPVLRPIASQPMHESPRPVSPPWDDETTLHRTEAFGSSSEDKAGSAIFSRLRQVEEAKAVEALFYAVAISEESKPQPESGSRSSPEPATR